MLLRSLNCGTAAVNKGFVRRYVYVLQLLQLKGADIFCLINSI